MTNAEEKRIYRARWTNLRPGEATAHSMAALGRYAVRTEQEVADILGITRQAVQQIQRKAFMKIRIGMRHEIREHYH